MNHRYRPAPRPQQQSSRLPFAAATRLSSSKSAAARAAAARAAAAAAVAIVACLSLWTCSALAQRALPPELKSAADVKPQLGVIQAFVAGQVNNLKNDKDPKVQQAARDALARESGGNTSQAYQDAYTAALAQQLLPLAKSPSNRTRLLAAITLQKVANNTKNARLADAITPFVTDDSVAVALWAMRAAGPTIAPLAKAGAPTKLPAAIVEGVKKHPTNGDLVEEAYKARTLGNQVNATSAAVVAGEVLKLFEFRVAQYATTTPPRPEADRAGVNFLSLESLWATPTGKQLQPQIMQALVNFAGLAAQHAAARTEADRRPFIEKLKGVGAAFQQIASPKRLNDPAIAAAGSKLGDIRTDAPENEFTDRATAIMENVKAKFPNIKPFPTMDPGATAEPKEAEIVDTIGGEDVTSGGPTTKKSDTGTGAGAAATPQSPVTTPAPHTPPAAAPKQSTVSGKPGPSPKPSTPPKAAGK